MKFLFAALALAVSTVNATAQDAAPAKEAAQGPGLKVGSAAPAIKFGKFFKGKEVRSLAGDQTYVIECWATWCGPCVAAFPHLTEIAKGTAGKVSIIGVNVWDKQSEENLQAFVDKQGEKMGYSVTVDADSSIAEGWLKAAGQNGIPCAFVVVKGKIAWIGHPGELDAAMVLGLADGSLTPEGLEKLAAAKEALQSEINEKVYSKARAGDLKGALAAAEELSKSSPEAAQMLKDVIEKLGFMLLIDSNPGQAVAATVAITDVHDFLGKAASVAGKAKLSGDDANKLAAAADAFLAKLSPDDGREKVFLTILKADLLASQTLYSQAAQLLETAKPGLDPRAAGLLDKKIAGFKAKAATPGN